MAERDALLELKAEKDRHAADLAALESKCAQI